MRADRNLRRTLIIATVLVAAMGCTHVPVRDAALSQATAERIQAIGQGKPWYALINRVDGLPDVARWSNTLSSADIILVPTADATSDLVRQACQELAVGFNDPSVGPSLNVAVVSLRNNNNSYYCDAPKT